MQNLKKIFALSLVALGINACNSGGGSSAPTAAPTTGWTWISGSNQANALGIYGSPADMPGGRDLAVSWVDNSGNFWLFGGSGYAASGDSGMLNDLWEYVPSTGIWTWVAGPSSTNGKGSYGTQGIGSVLNLPGARIGAISWQDSTGNLWLFGGYGYATDDLLPGALNDLWKFTPSDHKWTWVSGADTINAAGAYGVKDIPGFNNTPGARLGAISWTESNGTQWLFGGATTIPTTTDYNDLWKFNITIKQWEWIAGDTVVNQAGVYGMMGLISVGNKPGSRHGASSWKDASGNMWLFGGFGLDSTGTQGYLNDIWKFDISFNTWVWIKGSKLADQIGNYGTQNIFNVNNNPVFKVLFIGYFQLKALGIFKCTFDHPVGLVEKI